MKRTLMLAGLVFLAGTAAAHAAGTLTTAPRSGMLGLHDMYCTVRNVSSSAPAQVRIEARRLPGEVDSSYTVTLAPGAGASHLSSDLTGYCAFVVLAGNKRYVRAAAILSDPADANRYVAAIPAE